MSRRDDILAAVDAVPALPPAAGEVVRLVQDPEVDLADVCRAIELDASLTSNLLRLANSPWFRASREIDSVRAATVRLGLNTVFELVLSTVLAPIARRPVQGYDLPAGDLWEHSVAVGIGARQLAQILGRPAPQGLFTAGLLVDIGKIVLGSYLEVDARPVMDAAFDHGLPFDAAEREVLGIDHAEVGATLLDRWNLPRFLVDAVRWHHSPERHDGEPIIVDLVHAADVCCMMGGVANGSDGLHYHISAASVDRLSLTNLVVERVVSGVFTELGEVRGMFAHD